MNKYLQCKLPDITLPELSTVKRLKKETASKQHLYNENALELIDQSLQITHK